jgi:hypothetical protein
MTAPDSALAFAVIEPELDLERLNGLKVLLEKCVGDDCCRNTAFAKVRNRRADLKMIGSDAHRVELRCLQCDSHRAWLEDDVSRALLTIIAHVPEAKTDVLTIRGIRLAPNPAQGQADTKQPKRGRKRLKI